jgi:hypothetical protein
MTSGCHVDPCIKQKGHAFSIKRKDGKKVMKGEICVILTNNACYRQANGEGR